MMNLKTITKAITLILPDYDTKEVRKHLGEPEEEHGVPKIVCEWDWSEFGNTFDLARSKVAELLFRTNSMGGSESPDYDDDTLYRITVDGVRMIVRLFTSQDACYNDNNYGRVDVYLPRDLPEEERLLKALRMEVYLYHLRNQIPVPERVRELHALIPELPKQRELLDHLLKFATVVHAPTKESNL